jgi:putative resolvase
MTWNDRPGGSGEEAGERGITLDGTVTGVGSGVHGNLATLRRILADPRVSGIVVEHRDRLAPFGVEHREAALAATGRRIIVVNQDEVDEVTEDLVRDMTRGRGRRCVLALMVAGSARRRAEAGVRCVTAEVVAQ